MLIRKDNEIEIWTDVPEKGEAKHCFIAAIFASVILMICFCGLEPDYTIKETYFALLIFVGIPTILFIIAGFISLINEKEKAQLILKVNSEYMEIYEKKRCKEDFIKSNK